MQGVSLFTIRIFAFGWGSTWTWWTMIVPGLVAAIQIAFSVLILRHGLAGLQERQLPGFLQQWRLQATVATAVFWSMQVVHTAAVLLFSQFSLNPGMHPMHRLGGHVSTCFVMAAVVCPSLLACPWSS